MTLVTVSNVQDNTDPHWITFEGITRDEASKHVVFKFPRNKHSVEMCRRMEQGIDVLAHLDEQDIVPQPDPFHMVAEDFAKSKLANSIDEEDARILDMMRSTARMVAEHDHAMLPTTRTPDREMMQIAQARRGAEAELGRKHWWLRPRVVEVP